MSDSGSTQTFEVVSEVFCISDERNKGNCSISLNSFHVMFVDFQSTWNMSFEKKIIFS